MALRQSTGMRDARLEKRALINEHAVIAIGNGATSDGGGATYESAASDRITDSGNGLANFTVGDMLWSSGWDETSCNTGDDAGFQILGSAAGYVDVLEGSFAGSDASNSAIVYLAAARGGSIVDLFRMGVQRLYTGGQPSSGDVAETGTYLIEISENDGAFAGGTFANGLNFDVATSGVLAKDTYETWKGAGAATGTAGWGRMYDNAYTTGASTSAVRFDFTVGTSGADLTVASASIESAVEYTINSGTYTIPA